MRRRDMAGSSHGRDSVGITTSFAALRSFKPCGYRRPNAAKPGAAVGGRWDRQAHSVVAAVPRDGGSTSIA
jgi:hypothetical protein